MDKTTLIHGIRRFRRSKAGETLEAVLLALFAVIFLKTYVVEAYEIPSGSMEQTLRIGDRILVNKFLYGVTLPFSDTRLLAVRDPARGDVIVFKYPEDESQDFIKRIIGLPGDTIEVIDKVVYVNGKPLIIPSEQHTDPISFPATVEPRDNLARLTVPENSYFVMGDNRDHSLDSRFWGFVNRGKIEGKAMVIYWSWSSRDKWIRPERFGALIS